jgi:hypothetical protein
LFCSGVLRGLYLQNAGKAGHRPARLVSGDFHFWYRLSGDRPSQRFTRLHDRLAGAPDVERFRSPNPPPFSFSEFEVDGWSLSR